MNEHPSGLTVHLAESLDLVADLLSESLSGARTDPFAADVVCVPGPGVQRWLAQRLSRTLGAVDGDGVCAGVDFSDLGELCREALAGALGAASGDDRWRSEQLTWALLRAFDGCAGEAWFEPLAVHLAAGDDARPGRRYATAQRLARLYRRWLRWRPADLERWLTGDDCWQARLWRAVVDQAVEPTPFARHRAALQALRDEPRSSQLPAVLHAVAPGPVEPGTRDAVAALAGHRRIHVWLVVPDASAAAQGRAGGALAASLSRARARQAEDWCVLADTVEVHRAQAVPNTALGALQSEIRGGPPLSWPSDRTLQVHSSHGPERQVEVLRDVLLDLLQRDRSLEPRDILVVTPDLETFGPLVRARCCTGSTDEGGHHPAQGIRIAVADRSLRQTNPVLDVLARVLDLVTSRAEVAELLDLCATAPVARRFGFSGEADRLASLMHGSGMRWGMDAGARRRFGVTHPQNTWQSGLNRLLLGVAMPERELRSVGNTLPYDLVESRDVPLLGGLAELVGRLRSAAEVCAVPATPSVWASRLRAILLGEHDDSGVLVGGLVSVPAGDAWQVAQAQSQLTAIGTSSGADAPPLALGDIRTLIRERLQGRLPRSALLTGNLTVTSPDALPNVPHRVVVLLGLDEQTFPRPVVAHGDDNLGRAPGEPDPALDDRQSFIDALMSARETFVIVQRGRDTRTNDEVPAPIPVRELVGAAAAHGVDIVTHHRLQPYDLEGFVPGAPASFDPAAAAGARALGVGRSAAALQPRDRLCIDDLPAAPRPESISLDDLEAFMRHPLRAFRKDRLGLPTAWSDELSGQIPLELTGLDSWNVKRRLLDLRLAGHDRIAAETGERLRGTIPPGALGDTSLARASGEVESLLARAAPLLSGCRAAVDVSIDLPCGVALSGRVVTYDQAVVSLTPGFPKGKDVVSLWVRLLAAAVSAPRRPWRGCLVTQGSVTWLRAPLDPLAMLVGLVDAYLTGMDGLLVLPADTAWVTAVDRAAGTAPPRAAKEWGFERGQWAGYAPHDYDELLRLPDRDGRPGFLSLVEGLYGPVAAAREPGART